MFENVITDDVDCFRIVRCVTAHHARLADGERARAAERRARDCETEARQVQVPKIRHCHFIALNRIIASASLIVPFFFSLFF